MPKIIESTAMTSRSIKLAQVVTIVKMVFSVIVTMYLTGDLA